MPLKRSQRSRNLSLHQFETQRKRQSSENLASSVYSSTASLRPSYSEGVLSGEQKSGASLPNHMVSPRLSKRLRTSLAGLGVVRDRESRPSVDCGSSAASATSATVLCCEICKQTALNFGMYMYLDQVYCSEGCRSEAIAIDEIGTLRLS
mmetsp:Transcript_1967/g.3597  ORF Transcript_1967/g.3597 Transcript_1967/m.3597 type:complete len:150 (+) Transcript_1967:242-691(+)